MPDVREVLEIIRDVTVNVLLTMLLALLLLSIVKPPKIALKELRNLKQKAYTVTVIQTDWSIRDYELELMCVGFLSIMLQINRHLHQLAAASFLLNFMSHWVVAVTNLIVTVQENREVVNVKETGIILIFMHIMQLAFCLFAYFKPDFVPFVEMDIDDVIDLLGALLT